MRKFIAFFIQYPIWANAIIVLTAGFGLLSMFSMRHSFFPETTPTKIFISVVYPGASPSEMENGVTTKLEEAVNGLDGVEKITSKSREDFANITLEAFEGQDLDDLLVEVKNAVDGVGNWPAGAERPIVTKQKTTGMSVAAFVSLQGPDNTWKLKEMGDRVERELRNTKEISELQVFGYPDLEIVVEVRESDLQRFNIRFDEIQNAIRFANLDMSGGIVKTTSEQIYIRSLNRSTDPEEIKKIIVRTQPDGQVVTVGELANVELKFSENPNKSFVDRRRSATFIISKLPNEDIGSIANVVEEYIQDFNKDNPEYNMKILFQFNDMLNERIYMLGENLGWGLFWVCLVLGAFLSLRLSAWVAFGIPFSFIGMFALGAMYGMTVNMISLFGMILVVGILVDDGIVIAENIYAHYERGKSPMQAALDGTMEVMSSVFTSVLTTMVAFGFLLFVGGDMEMMEEMAFSVIACLFLSLIEAFLILPSHLASKKLLQPVDVKWYQKLRTRIEWTISKLRQGHAFLLGKLMGWYRAWVFFPMAFIIVILILLINGNIRTAFFPNIPFDSITLEAAFKPGELEPETEKFLWETHAIIDSIGQEIIHQYNDTLITSVSLTVGTTESMGEIGPHTGNIRISVKENDQVSTNEIANKIKDRIPAYWKQRLEKFSVGGQEQFGKAVDISLQSEDQVAIKEAAQLVKAKLTVMPEVKTVVDNSGIGNRELHLELKPKAHLLGLTLNEILNQIRQGFYGAEVQRLIRGRDEIKIWVRYPRQDRKSVSQLENMRVKTIAGQSFPLHELVKYDMKRGKVGINHRNGAQEISVEADLYDSELSGEINSRFVDDIWPLVQEKYPNVQYSAGGQAEKAMDSGIRLGIAFILGVFLILVILSLNFASFYQARLILMVIPIGIFSAILGHGIEGHPFSMLSLWGVIALVGILVNDAVVMLDTYNRLLRSGLDVKTAAFEAGKSRFRPVILTSITTVAGLMPLIRESSFQAQFLIPMGISVAYGVLFATLLLIFFFPILILFFNDMRRAWFWLWRGGQYPPSRKDVEPIYKHMERENEMHQLVVLEEEHEAIDFHRKKKNTDDFSEYE